MALVSSEAELYRRLLETAPHAMSCIDSEDMEGLMFVLQEKQDIIDKIERLSADWTEIGESFGIPEGRVEPDFWERFMKCLPDKFSSTIRAALMQVRAIAQNVISTDKVAQEVLEVYVNKLRSRVSQISRGKNAFKGYAAAGGMYFSGR